ncbi:MAG: transposase, partial [Gammaproteobacteria bacterium]
MARPLRIELAGAFHHVMARGNARQSIFRGASDREEFLGILKRVCGRFDWRVWAYCLMDNHYHLLVETREPTLSRGMREINGIYTQRFNRRHARTGHVFQGRYKSLLIDKDAYLLEVSRYIVLNPVKAKLCRGAADYRWSNYRQTIGRATAPDWLVVNEVLKLFSSSRVRARQAYRKFVMEGTGTVDPFAKAGGGILGAEVFVAKVTRNLK